MSSPPIQPSHVFSGILPSKPVGLEANALHSLRVVRCLPHNSPGLFASEVTSFFVVAPAGAAQGRARLRRFVRAGALHTPGSGTNQMQPQLQRVLGDIEQALGGVYTFHPAVHGDIQQTLGCDSSTLPFMVSSFSDLTPFSQWVRLVWVQPILDEMLKQPGCSALGFRVVKIYGKQGDPSSSSYYPIVMTLGLGADSYAIAKLQEEMLGAGVVVINKSARSNRPTFTMNLVTSISQRERIIDLRAYLPGSGALLYPSPEMTGDMAALLLGLPQYIHEE